MSDDSSSDPWWSVLASWTAKWPEWLRSALVVLGPLLVGFTISVPGWWKLVSLTGGAIIWWAGHLSGSEARRQDKEELNSFDERLDQRLKSLVDELRTALGSYARSLGKEHTRAQRKEILNSALGSLVTQASWVTGPLVKTRANLFTIDCCDPLELRASSPASVGGNTKGSTRVFTEGDETLQAALDLEGRLVNNATEPAYRSYATAPVYADGRLYGILTADAPGPNDLSELDQLQLMFFGQVLGCVLATFPGTASVRTRG